MAKVTGPLFSLDARGKIADTLVYAIWKGLNYCRQYVIPFNPKTAGQQTIRGYFTDAVAAYQAEDQATKDIWAAAIKALGWAMSGFNYYVGKYVKYLEGHGGTPPTPPFLPTS
jgi:hypothetical protein